MSLVDALRAVPQVETEKRIARAEHLLQRPRLLAWPRPDLDFRDAVAGAERAGSLRQRVQHQPSISGNEAERNCLAMFETARIPRPSARMKSH